MHGGSIVEIRQLEYFVAAIRCGSYTKAADNLHITRQALSKAVKNLENELGKLVETDQAGRLVPTEKGLTIMHDALPVFEAWSDFRLKHSSLEHKQARHKTLTVAVGHGAVLSLPDGALDIFQEAHRDILLQIEEVTTEGVLDMADSCEADIGLVGSAPRYLQDFDIETVTKAGIYVYIPLSNPLAKRSTLSLEDLHDQLFATMGKRNHLHKYLMEECMAEGISPRIMLTSSDAEFLVGQAIRHNALFFGFPKYAHLHADTHSLVRLDLAQDPLFGTYAIKRKGKSLSPQAQQFWKYLATLPAKTKAVGNPSETK